MTLGHLAPLAVAVLAAILVVVGLSDRSAKSQVLVASRAIPAGGAVDRSDTRVVSIHSSDAALRGGLLPAPSLGGGWVAAAAIAPGDAITRSEVARSAGPSGLGSMSIPVALSDADGGGLAVGDRVDIIATSGPGGAQYVAQDLRVLAVPSTGTSGGVLSSPSSSGYYVVVAVDRPTALTIAGAIGAANQQGPSPIQIIRSTGESAGDGG